MIEAVVFGALIVIVTAFFMWSHFAQRRAMRKILASLTKEQLEVLKDVGSSPAPAGDESTSRRSRSGKGS
jgi:hypothetical protein